MLGVTASVPMHRGPAGVAVTPDGRYAYVPHYDSVDVLVVDLVTRVVTHTIQVGESPAAPAITPDGRKAYVAIYQRPAIAVIDIASNKVLTEIRLAGMPYAVAADPAGDRVYATCYHANGSTVVAIDTIGDTVDGAIPIDSNTPGQLAVSPDGSRVYVTDAAGKTTQVIDTASRTIIADLTLGASAVAVHPDNSRVYLGRASGATTAVLVVDTATLSVTAVVPVPSSPVDIAVSHDGAYAYVVSSIGEALSVIDTASNFVVASVPIKGAPIGVAVGPGRTPAYVTNAYYGIDDLEIVSEVVTLPHPGRDYLVGKLFGGVAVDGGGWIVVGNHIFKVPPRPGDAAAFVDAIAPFLGHSIENPEIGARLRDSF